VAAVIVVDCPEDVAVRRLVEHRGMDEGDVRRRMAAQASRSQRAAAADVVIHNDASLDDLQAQADATWEWIQARLHPNR
jgi:dephospho-CoA kinase